MTEETQEPAMNAPGYKSRKMLAAENDELKAGLAALMSRVNALESAKPAPLVDQIVTALKTDRGDARQALLERELREAQEQIAHLQRPETPTVGIPYKGPVQAKADCWDPVNGLKFGPDSPQAPRRGFGDVFYVDMPDYWPGCPFVPVIIKGTDQGTGLPIVEPHPDFQSH